MKSYECVVCLDTGCPHCPNVDRAVPSEPWPDETWTLLSDEDIVRLVSDAAAELWRRSQESAKQLERVMGL